MGAYSGTAGDSLSYHSEREFTTHDNDNDSKYSKNCATFEGKKSGGWWFGACALANLNAFNHGTNASVNWEHGIHWNEFGGPSISLKSAQMAIRPMN